MNLGAMLALLKLAQDSGFVTGKKATFFDIPISTGKVGVPIEEGGLGLPPPPTLLTEAEKRALRS